MQPYSTVIQEVRSEMLPHTHGSNHMLQAFQYYYLLISIPNQQNGLPFFFRYA